MKCTDCGDPCIDAGPGLGWQCVSRKCRPNMRPTMAEEMTELSESQAQDINRQPTARSVLALMESRFTSLNPIPVERASISRNEWDSIVREISRLDTALFRAWDDLNELRHDAHEAEARVFDVIEGKKACGKINVVSTAESPAGIPAAETVTSGELHLGKSSGMLRNNSPSSDEK